MKRKSYLLITIALAMALFLTGCGSKPATSEDPLADHPGRRQRGRVSANARQGELRWEERIPNELQEANPSAGRLSHDARFQCRRAGIHLQRPTCEAVRGVDPAAGRTSAPTMAWSGDVLRRLLQVAHRTCCAAGCASRLCLERLGAGYGYLRHARRAL